MVASLWSLLVNDLGLCCGSTTESLLSFEAYKALGSIQVFSGLDKRYQFNEEEFSFRFDAQAAATSA